MQDFWNTLKSHLVVNTELAVFGDPRPVRIMFSVTNNAPTRSDSSPIIEFEEVTLSIGIPPDFKAIQLGKLSPGERTQYEHRCSYMDLLQIQFKVSGKVSTEAFFRVGQAPTGVSAHHNPLNVEAYLQVLHGLDVHQWLQKRIKSMVPPTATTTLAELDSLSKSLDIIVGEIRDAESLLQRLTGYMDRPSIQATEEHRRATNSYFQETLRAINEIRENLRTREPKSISHTLESQKTKLESLAKRLDEATHTLESNSKR